MANPLSIRCRWLWAAASGLAIALAGCANRPPAPELASSALPVQYVGTLPCADCAGIVYRLILGRAHRYVLRQHYQTDRPSTDVIETGHWAIRNHGRRLKLTPSDTDYAVQSTWRIDGHQALTALDDEDQPIASANQYRLERRAAPAERHLTGVRWQLTNAPDEATASPAYIRFDEQPARLHGSTGCNRLTAAYRRHDDGLDMHRLATTRRDCPGHMDTEQSLTAALRHTSRFAVLGRYLMLFGSPADPAPLAVFRAAR